MIIDTLANAGKYKGFHKLFAKAFDYINSQSLDSIEPGKYPVDGTDIHASVSLKDGVKAADAKFEAHNNYIDIQVCPTGTEQIGWKPRAACVNPKGDYNTEKDVIFYNDAPDTYFSLNAGQFAIFFPEDVHAPMIGEGPIKKLVVKVKL
ncbi:MAG TPA: YhcH/YjgK/YiaL family protein [Chitinophagaceae bacterium]|jgi:YhcH/YjgK/YiaL family protein